MENLQISMVNNVTLTRRGYCITGTLMLSTYHLVFSFFPDPNAAPKEIWICYPIIGRMSKSRGSSWMANRSNPFNSASYNGSKDTSLAKFYQEKDFDHYSASHIRLQCKDFTFYSFDFVNDLICTEVFYKLSALVTTPKVQSDIRAFYAFNYSPNMLESGLATSGWDIYEPEEEYARLGLINDYWRTSKVNEGYKMCVSYPEVLIVPSSISDNVVKHASKFRSKQRIPAIVYKHKLSANGNVIARCAQPLVGLNIQNRSLQDEKLIGEIFNTQAIERLDTLDEDSELSEQPQRNLIVDLRPITNAMAQHALGAGTENIENYKGRALTPKDNENENFRNVDKIFCNIDNIHVMRDSLNKLTTALNDLDDFSVSVNADSQQVSYALVQQALSKSQWLHRLSIILQSVDRISKSVHLNNTNVLIHCSDGWDRTSQVSALAQLCLDPYYRTLKGFMVLIEKEWVSFGFKFSTRADHGGCIGAILPKPLPDADFGDGSDSGGGARAVTAFLQRAANKAATHIRNTASAAAAAGSSAAGSTSPQPSSSTSSLPLSTGTPVSASASVSSEIEDTNRISQSSVYGGSSDKSPVFHQYLDCVYQIYRQHPTAFEFNSRFLKRLFYHYYSCQYGTFLCDSEKEYREARSALGHTVSVWDYFNSRPSEFTNPNYSPQEDVLFFNFSDVKWWTELYGRSDEEMNGLSNSLDRKFAKMSVNGK